MNDNVHPSIHTLADAIEHMIAGGIAWHGRHMYLYGGEAFKRLEASGLWFEISEEELPSGPFWSLQSKLESMTHPIIATAGDFLERRRPSVTGENEAREVMLDLETLGIKPGCQILSIGVAAFSLSGGCGDTFYRNILGYGQEALGLTIDPNTQKWWSERSEEARQQLLVGQVHILEAITDFLAWWKQTGAVRVWCQGANFDAPILEEVITRLGHKIPWRYDMVRDTRTAYHLYGLNPKSIKREGTYHNALDDALHQVRLVQAAYANR